MKDESSNFVRYGVPLMGVVYVLLLAGLFILSGICGPEPVRQNRPPSRSPKTGDN